MLLIAITLILLKLGVLLCCGRAFFLIVGTDRVFGLVVALRWASCLSACCSNSAAIAIVPSVLLAPIRLNVMGTSDAVLPWH